MRKLSAVIITLNEEKNIRRCLTSVKDIVDEIVVVDSGSTDRTREICQEFDHLKFITHPFEGHIQQKNWATQQARFDHCLALDADEALSSKLRSAIGHVKEHWQYDGYYFNRLTNYCGKWVRHCGWYPDRKLRLWDRRKGQWAGENPHDRLVMDEASTKLFLEGDLLHYSFYTIEEHIRTINNFSSIAAREKFNKGKRTNLFKILTSPVWKFIKSFVLKAGFLDGFYGYVICRNSAHSTFLKHVKIRELQRQSAD
jgi:glycosyltransferase involved in cell wall biosynthesis